MHPNDPETPDNWYYSIGDRVHGPLALSDLEELLDKSGDTASEVRIRKGTGGQWVFRSPAGRTSGSQRVLSQVSFPDALKACRECIHSGPLAGAAIGMVSWVSTHRIAALLVVAWILLTFGILGWPRHAKERNCIEVLRKIMADAEHLRATEASDAQWHELTDRSQKALAPIVKELKESQPSEITQLLLWAARDAAPRLLHAETTDILRQEQRLKHVLNAIDGTISND
jgi:hypothetical protein